jgi:hypothetical protein
MSVSNVDVSLRFAQTQGLDPIFRTVDGSNCNHVLSQQDEIDLFNFLSAL